MTACEHCRLPIGDGWHSPGWCFDYVDGQPAPGPAIAESPVEPTTEVDRDERNRRYRAGLCIDCGQGPPAPARPRCWPCHDSWARPHEPALSRRRIERCARCGRPGAVAGNVLCGPCRRERSS